MSCSQNTAPSENKAKATDVKQEPHQYGGWYCPDNLRGFPAVDLLDWKNVPVVNGRMATKEETQNGTSLIFVDLEKYPDAKPMEMKMPQLARYFNHQSGKSEIIIVIQALKISTDSVVGFRFLNGGNGSARLNEVNILSEKEIQNLIPGRFVTIMLDVKASKAAVWEVLTNVDYNILLRIFLDKNGTLPEDWRKSSKVNFKYQKAGHLTAAYAGDVWGNQYIQVDTEMMDYQYVEKIMVSENEEGTLSNMHIVCGVWC